MKLRPGQILIILMMIIFSSNVRSKVCLPELVSNGMILQRDTQNTIWGWADRGEQITVTFKDSVYTTLPDSNGCWSVVLPAVNAGGPYSIQIRGKNSITLNNILFGDVWICSGQSNMELPLRRVSWVYDSLMNHYENDNIRQFYVPRTYNFTDPQHNIASGAWKPAVSENISDFSATAFFFAKALYEQYQIPVGLINTALGGSPVQAWMSKDALKSFPHYYHQALMYKDSELVHLIQKSDSYRRQVWYDILERQDNGKKTENNWLDPDTHTDTWESMQIPGFWTNPELADIDGAIWFRKTIQVPPALSGKQSKLILGRIVDADSVFLNGHFVGTTSYQYPPRRYDIPRGVLQTGENTIVIRVINERGRGGFFPDKPYTLAVGDQHIDLTGEWKYKLGTSMPPLSPQTFIRWKPMGLYNAMIAPLLNYRIKGVIWYQGESNTGNPVEYRELFPTMIRDWRNQFGQGAFPFLYVQLPNYMRPSPKPQESDWALLRESQLKTLSLSKTGMAVAIDIGEWNDIHPLNKKDVGHRLARAARHEAYGEKIVYSGPIYKSMQIDGDKIILSFEHTGSGLLAKGGDSLKSFAIAGLDKQFVRAQAEIKKNNVVVWSHQVKNPVAVRYAWANNPDQANLYNKEGLPASPFRTDQWNAKETK
ncbi:MAG: sialate O-acetylesterase [candidate division KSB1 bacterium]|nr:sialate O-acetylesterase [candidate division KSB1 bacterium]